MSESHQREAAIFDAALELPQEQRAAHLDRACGEDTALRQRVEALLKECDGTSGYLDAPPGPAAIRAASDSTPFEKPGDRIGRYKLLQQIGVGGCGVVYMAEQEEPVRRRVALKVIKLGMDTKSVIARFEAERQALAMMDHPNIARVLDAGATETGRPYFVMELVRGVKITDYCDQLKLSTRQRLDLFISVCQAVQHAHQKGIVHRDLKPSNILVTEHDGAPVPKIIDFGIAKATTDQRLTDKTLFTAFEQFIGTPAYTSPEQAGLGGLDIDTRSDIYSLGVLLYELLTGQPPFSPAAFQRSAIDEILRIIRENEPPRPSARLTTLNARELTTVAQHRQIESAKLSGILRGDLDWIVMKCLEKDRTRRYETANGLAADIQRHLNYEPVLACPPSNLYRFQKLVRRNKLALGASISVAAALMIGLSVSTWMFVEERAANRRALAGEKLARSEAARSEEESIHARHAEADAKENLWHSYLAQAQARRFSGRMGRRFESLEALRKAAEIRSSPELRNEAIACMALPDLRIKTWDGLPKGVTRLQFDPAYERYATGDEDGNVIISRISDQRELMRLVRFEPPIYELSWSRQGRLVLTYFATNHHFQVWDLDTLKPIINEHGSFRTWDFSSKDEHFAVARFDRKTIDVYSLASREKIASLEQAILPNAVKFNPAGDRLAISSALISTVMIRDAQSGEVLQTLRHPRNVRNLAWHPDGRLLAVACSSGDIYVWNTAESNLVTVLKGHSTDAINVKFSSSGRLLASTGWDATFRLWEPLAGKELISLPVPTEQWTFGPADPWFGWINTRVELGLLDSALECRQLWSDSHPDHGVHHVSVDHSGRLLFSSSRRDGVRVWDLERGKELCTFAEEGCREVYPQPDLHGVITISDSGLLKRWPVDFDIRSADVVRRVGPASLFGPPGAWGLCLSADGQTLAFAKKGTIHVWDANALTEKHVLTGHADYWSIDLSGNGQFCAASTRSGSNVTVWETFTNKLLKELSVGSSSNVRFSPDNRWLVTGSSEEYQFWQTDTWHCARTIPRRGTGALRGFLAFAPDSRTVAVTDSINSVRLLDVASGRELAVLEAPEQRGIHYLAFAPTGQELVVASATGAIQVWNLRLIRAQLAAMNLDWDLPPYPPARQSKKAEILETSAISSGEAK